MCALKSDTGIKGLFHILLMGKIIRLWFPVLIWAMLIFYFSSIPALCTPLGVWDFILRKTAHFFEFFILTFFLYRAFKGTFDLKMFYLIFWAAGLSFLYAVSDELHQSFVPMRYPSFRDVIIDSLGILLFIIIVKFKGIRSAR